MKNNDDGVVKEQSPTNVVSISGSSPNDEDRSGPNDQPQQDLFSEDGLHDLDNESQDLMAAFQEYDQSNAPSTAPDQSGLNYQEFVESLSGASEPTLERLGNKNNDEEKMSDKRVISAEGLNKAKPDDKNEKSAPVQANNLEGSKKVDSAIDKSGPKNLSDKEIKNAAIADFKKVYKEVLEMRKDFAGKPGYVRKKQPDEQAYHKAKAAFGGEFSKSRKAMERNTNGGKGVDVILPGGKRVHIENQAQLYDKVVQFNKERGDFYDEKAIAEKSPEDHARLKSLNHKLDHSKANLLACFDTKRVGYKMVRTLEDEVKKSLKKSGTSDKNASEKEDASGKDGNKEEKSTKQSRKQYKGKKSDESEEGNSETTSSGTGAGYLPSPGGAHVAQTNLAGGLGHAFGKVINGVFSGIGMAVGSSLAAAKQTKDALNTDSPATSISNKLEAGAHFHFSPANQALNDSFNEQTTNDWKNNRIDAEYLALEQDIDSHLRAVDRLKATEWAQKLKHIESSGDKALKEKAPTILNQAKSKLDFKDANKDLSYFLDNIKQRAEKLAGIAKDSNLDTNRFETIMAKWQEEAKKRLEDLPDGQDKKGILDRIQRTAENILTSLSSMFKPSAKMAQ